MKILEITIPGSKSFTNRALVMAALAPGKSTILNASTSDDSRALIAALQKLGVKIHQSKQKLQIFGNGGFFPKFKGKINVGAAGTTMRFLTALCALVPGEIILDGSLRMRQRPISALVEALRELGADIEYLGQPGCPPLKINGGKILGGQVSVDGTVSSQFLTALLLIAPVLPKKMTINVVGTQISRSYLDMTNGTLAKFGVQVKNSKYQRYVIDSNERYRPTDYQVEADLTGANYFLAAAALGGGVVKIRSYNPLSAQGDRQFLTILEAMGCQIETNQKEQWVKLTGPIKLQAVDADMANMPDSAQTLAVLAAFAKGTSRLTGLTSLRIKETDRISALQKELQKMGIRTKAGDDWLTIWGGRPHGATIETYKDHRMAMSFAVAATKIAELKICEPEVVSKSFPQFWNLFYQLS